MLKKLFISNYAIIDSIEIDFTEGFTTITGDTGAGKSIILGALNLILGKSDFLPTCPLSLLLEFCSTYLPA